MTETPPAAARRLRPIVALAVVMLLAVVAVYTARKAIAREVLVGWLRARGIAAEAQVDSLGWSGAAARLRIGDPRNPDFAADRIEVGYGLKGLGLNVRTITLTAPVLRARLHDGRLSVGALDPLIAEFRKRPPTPDATKPTIVVRGGRLLLATDYGPVDVRADVRIADSRLVSATARSAPLQLRGSGFDLSVGPATATAQSEAGRLAVTLDAPIIAAGLPAGRFEGGRLRLTAATPYPDAAARADGAVVLHAELTGRRLAGAGQALSDADLAVAFTGEAHGGIADLAVTGRGVADLRAAAATSGAGQANALRAAVTAQDLRWSRSGGDAVSAQLKLTGLVDEVAASALRLQAVNLTAAGPLRAGRRGVDLRLSASALAHGSWSGLGAPAPADAPQLAAVKRAAQGFRLAVPGVSVALSAGAPAAALTRPAQLLPDRGGAVTLAATGSGWRLAAAGGGLPRVTADIAHAALTPGGGEAEGRIHANLSLGPLAGGDVDASGRFSLSKGALTFAAARCVAVQAQRLTFGANSLSDIAGQLCPTTAPMLRFGADRWRLAASAKAVRARAPFAQVQLSNAAGAVDLGAAGGRLDGAIAISAATLADTTQSPRFRPLGVSGTAGVEGGVWSARLGVAAAGHHIADATLRHDGRRGAGRFDVDTGPLTFAADGLQPSMLSPLAAAIGAPAVGAAQFTGRLAWSAAGVTSSGRLSIPSLDFTSPAGAVHGLSGEVAFSSLAPLVAAPGQRLHVARIDGLVPVTDVDASFGLDAGGLHVVGGQAAVGGGSVRIASLDLPMGTKAPVRGDLELVGVQLHDLVEASPFGDKVELQAKVSGRLPFTAEGVKVRVSGGDLRAIEPGRLSIDPRAISSLAGSGSGGAAAAATPAPTDTFTGLAYQAMSDLAFDTLAVSVDSQADGRLGLLFHIVGRHDPPQKQQLRISLLDLIGKKFLDRDLPLPSGTQVNLTLDTSLNLDDLLADYANYQALRSSGAVQP